MDSLKSDSQTQFNFWDHLYNQQYNLKTPKVISHLKTYCYISLSSTEELTIMDKGFWSFCSWRAYQSLEFSLFKQFLFSFLSYCHDFNAFRFVALQCFDVNNFGFFCGSLATMFWLFQFFNFFIWASQFYRFGCQNFTWTMSIYCSSWQGLCLHATRVWLKTSRSKWLCFQSEIQAQGVWPFSQKTPTALTIIPFEL